MSLQSWQSNRKYILSEIMITLYSIKQIGVITWFIWVPAHVGIIGNEEVDIMATEFLIVDVPSINIALSRTEGKTVNIKCMQYCMTDILGLMSYR